MSHTRINAKAQRGEAVTKRARTVLSACCLCAGRNSRTRLSALREVFGLRGQSAAATPLLGCGRNFQSGVVLRFPPQSKKLWLWLCRDVSLPLGVKTQLCRSCSAAWLVLFVSLPLFAQTNAETTNALPKLLPPYGEMPPTFWEQHGISVGVTVPVLVVLVVLGIWLYLRPEPQAILPPEVQARLAFEALRQCPEDGACLSKISQILRNYFIRAFQLPPGELTTAEFCRAISSQEQIGAELSSAIADFLHQCDERKFSPSAKRSAEFIPRVVEAQDKRGINSALPAQGGTPMGAATQALELLAQAESRRAQPQTTHS